MHEAGHEVACHTVSHKRMAGEARTFVEAEVLEGRRQLAQCGVPEGDIAGFRAPFLSVDAQLRRVLHEGGFLYDRCCPGLDGSGQTSARVGMTDQAKAGRLVAGYVACAAVLLHPCRPACALCLPRSAPLQLSGGRGARRL